MRRIILSALVIASAALGGCAVRGTASYGGTLTATTVAPDLVYVSPGVQVVADYEYPVFYSDNYYWRYDGGRWYRSSWYTGGWVYAAPPRAVLSVERPYAYRYYRPRGYVSRRAPVRDHRDYRDSRPVYRESRPVYRESRPVYRESRPVYRESRPVYRESRPAPRQAQPVVRDHREPRRAAPPAREPRPVVRDHRDDRDRR